MLQVRKEGKKGSLLFLLIEHSSLTETVLAEMQRLLSTSPNMVYLPRQADIPANLFTTEQDAFQVCDAVRGRQRRKNYPDSVVLLACATSADEVLGDYVDYVLDPQILSEQLRGIMLAEQSRRSVINRRLNVAKRHSFDYTATGYVLSKEQTHMLLIPKGDQWFPPGGHVEPGEYPDEALQREILEETGYVVNFLGQQESIGMRVGDAVVHAQPYVILCEDLGTHYHFDFLYLLVVTDHGQANTAKPELEGRWVELAQIEQLQAPEDVKWVVQKLVKSRESSPIWV